MKNQATYTQLRSPIASEQSSYTQNGFTLLIYFLSYANAIANAKCDFSISLYEAKKNGVLLCFDKKTKVQISKQSHNKMIKTLPSINEIL